MCVMACQPRLDIAHVDPALDEMVSTLIAEINEEIGYVAVSISSNGRLGSIDVVASWDKLDYYDEATGTRAAGMYIPIPGGGRIVVPPPNVLSPDSKVRYSATSVNNILAHEIGHALGLKHSSTGIMTPVNDVDCLRREAKCLVAALVEQGLLTR